MAAKKKATRGKVMSPAPRGDTPMTTDDNEGKGGAATATANAPEETPKKEWQDRDKVTVLHGWGRVESYDKHFVDKTLFTGGIAHDVLYGTAKHWISNTRPDGKQEHVYGKVEVIILPQDATEADFIKATGIDPMPMQQFANMLAGIDLDALVAQMGAEKVSKLIDGLKDRVPSEKVAR